MRDFFIRSFEMLVNVLVVLMSTAVIIASLVTMLGLGASFGVGAGMGPGMGPVGRFLMGLGVLILGGAYVIFVAGLMYLGLGIYQNTRRTAELMERMTTRN